MNSNSTTVNHFGFCPAYIIRECIGMQELYLLFQNNMLTKPSQILKPIKHAYKIILHDSAIKITR